MKTRAHELETIKEHQMLTQHEGHVFFHIIRDDIYVHLLLFTFFIFVVVLFCYLANLLHNKTATTASQMMKNNWNLTSQLEHHIIILMSRSYVFFQLYDHGLRHEYLSQNIFYYKYDISQFIQNLDDPFLSFSLVY